MKPYFFMDNDSFINIALLAAGLVQGILIIAVLLIKGRQKKYTGLFLYLMIFILTVQILFKLLSSDWLLENYVTLYYISFFFPYLYGPLTYLYITKSFTNSGVFKPKDVLHFTPFVLSVSIILVNFHSGINLFHYININVYNIADTAFQLLILSIYIYFSKQELKRISESRGRNISGFAFINKWFTNFANLTWINGAVVIITLTFVYYQFLMPDIKYFFLTLPLFMYWISYKALTQPDIFISSNGAVDMSNPVKDNGEKYKKTGLSTADAERILAKINCSLEKNELHLNPEISLEKFSLSIDVPKHHVSQVINQMLGKSFNDLINEKRVQKAQSLLKDISNNKYTVAAIAFESGFNSISSFNDVFKKYTGTTPSKYRNYNKN